jgi:peptide/nickel transport system substrate-binding protein
MKRMFLSLILLLLVLSASLSSGHAITSSLQYGKWGPRSDYLQLLIYNSYEAEANAFQSGSIDVMDWPLDYSTYQAIKNSANFVNEPLTMYDIYDIDINNLRWPTSDYHFRRAIAYLIDYEKFYTDVLRAYSGELMDNIIWSESVWSSWYSPNTWKYWFDNSTALAILAAAGYQDWDHTGTLEWKAPNGTIIPLPNLEFYAREDDPIRHALGDMINAELNAIGIPTHYVVASEEICWSHAYKMPYDFNLFTAGMGPFRDVQFLYDYYHSQFATPDVDWAMNNVFFANSTYDQWVEKMKFAADEATAMDACKHAQEIFMDQMPLIPVYHSAGSEAYAAKYAHHTGEEAYWDKPWNGFVNSLIPMVNSGVDDWWSLLNAHPGDVQNGGVLRFGMINDADHVNPVTSYSTWDAILLDELYSTLIMRDPYNGDVLPWLAKGWKIETWDNGGKNATKLTITLNDNLKWSDGTSLNSTDVAFTMKYMYDASSASYYAYVQEIDGIDTDTPHIETPDANTIVIYYTVQSIWALEWAGTTPIMPKNVWQTIPANDTDAQGEFVKTGNLTVSGPFLIDSYLKGQWWLLRRNPYFFRVLPDALWTFNVTGLEDYTGTSNVVTVDGVDYKTSSASPLVMSFINGTTHTYAFMSNISSNTNQYTWQNCTGDNTQISGTIMASRNGSITANYTSIIPEYTGLMFYATMMIATLTALIIKKKRKPCLIKT